jgi:hypothetical protein
MKKIDKKETSLVDSMASDLTLLKFSDRDFTKAEFLSVLKMCTKGVPPEIAMRAKGKLNHYLFMKGKAEAFTTGEEALQLEMIDAYFNRALATLLGNTFNHAMSEDGRTALMATKMLLELQATLENKNHPIVIKDR